MKQKKEERIRAIEKEQQFYASVGDLESEAECHLDLVMLRNSHQTRGRSQ